MKAFIINLDRDKDRWRICEELLKQSSFEYQRVPAVLGGTIERSSYPWIGKEDTYIIRHNLLSKAVLKGNLKDGELGCALSHLNVYNMILNDDSIDGAVVMEDDCKTHHLSCETLIKALAQVPQADIISLVSAGHKSYRNALWNTKKPILGTDFYIKRFGMKGPLRINFDWLLNRRRRVAGAVAYYVSKKACLKLLTLAYPVRLDADSLTGMLAYNKLDYYMIVDKDGNSICTFDEDCTSVIGVHGGTRFY